VLAAVVITVMVRAAWSSWEQRKQGPNHGEGRHAGR